MRTPDFKVGDYLHRWWLVPKNRWANVYLHRFHESDEPVPHDHPWMNVSVLLRGRYREHYHDGTWRDYGPGAVIFRQARSLHWLEVLEGPVTTLFLTGPRRRQWGFQTPSGWVPSWRYEGTRHRALTRRLEVEEETVC